MSENEHYIKCPICWGEKLGELSDIKDNEERFEKLNEFMQNTIEYDINETEKELFEKFIEVLYSLHEHATHNKNPFANLAWVKNAIKIEIVKWEKQKEK